MVPRPKGQNAQVQRLTTALKNICRDYPAGGTVLRELLQNADDAGATEVRFVLDENTYIVGDPLKDLIHPKLEQYQGPALLAYNNAVFTDKDFDSLSRLGDSLKLDDGSTTGKFGRGFNSVYNWTDSPSIVSRERFLILDPHYEWSHGGPYFDFVEDSGDAAIQNHMAAFGMVMKHFDRQLDGTVIRVPLRTKAQAVKSEISKRETTVSDLLEVFRSFASEFGGDGLLFMRNLEKLEIKSSSMLIKIQILDADKFRLHRSKVNNAVKTAFKDPHYSFDHSFELEIEYGSAGEAKKTKFVVHHSIQCGRMNKTLSAWAKEQNYIPWVAVAAQVPTSTATVINGSLFTVLPLPIVTNQPVHIHGLFSISPDRARLYQLGEKSAQDQDPANWNKCLFQLLVPAAWTNLLRYMADLCLHRSNFDTWPQSLHDTRDPLNTALEKVTEIIGRESLAVWPTVVGYKTEKTALLATGLESNLLIAALREAQVPLVSVPKRLQNMAENIFKDRILCPQNLCTFLKGVEHKIKLWSQQTKHDILEYLLSKPGFIDYDDLDLFPFKNGTYRSIGESVAYVHRDNIEEALFNLEDARNLDLGKLSKATQKALKRGCETLKIHPSIRFRTSRCLREYCSSTIFKNVAKDQDFVALDKFAAETVSKIWIWITTRAIGISDQEISDLWLFPLSSGLYRKIKPRASSPVYFASPGKIGDLMVKLDAKTVTKPFPLVDIETTHPAHSLLSMNARSQGVLSALQIQDPRRIVSFLTWLQENWSLIQNFNDEEKMSVGELLASQLSQKLTTQELTVCSDMLKQLPIFQKVSWMDVENKREPILTWTALSYCSKTIGLFDVKYNPAPDIDSVQFVTAAPASWSHKILQAFKLAENASSEELIQNHIIPAWKIKKAHTWSTLCKEQLASFILTRFSLLSPETLVELRTIPMIPASQLNGLKTSKFTRAASLIDPSVSELRDLCFDDEGIVPEITFLGNFKTALIGCGLKTAVDEEVVYNRIRCYASTNHPLQEIQKRAQNLLNSFCHWTSPSVNQVGSDLQRLLWLPAMDHSGTLSLKAAQQCRSSNYRLLVGSHLAILEMSISTEWEVRMGWHETLSADILLSQLNAGVQAKDRNVVDAVLRYISKNSLVETLLHELVDIPCVLTTHGSFVIPSQTFRPPISYVIGGCDGLQPYLANVDRNFWRDHTDLLVNLGVGDKLQPSDLLKVQEILEAKPSLDVPDIKVAVELVNLASEFPRIELTSLKVISESGVLYPIQDISYGDLGPLKSKGTVVLTHPDIPRKTILLLGISSLRERLVKGILEIEDVDDEDEFDQQEKVTTRIADTLDRYSVEATFREYLANAEDTEGASSISWLLDEREYPNQKLLTTEMEMLQGPALLVHNDGVFSHDDFEGLRNVGEGSKAQVKTTIGQFGRGSQTMYHWTDVPMILSGSYLLILDPQQEVLPKNQIKGRRKPGVKLLLSKVRDACGDQLAPFEGLWDYTQGLDHYPGTIFRFPLRTASKSSESALRNSKRILGKNEVSQFMSTYFDEARISLLFLKRIKSIDFRILGQLDSGWSVARQQSSDENTNSFSKSLNVQYTWMPNYGTQISGKDAWLVVSDEFDPEANLLPDNSRRVTKNAECGIAALVSSTTDTDISNIGHPSCPKIISPRMFNRLPLPIQSDLPVHIHGTFSLSGDRQTIEVDECGTQSRGDSWNRYLSQEILPKLYLSFLESLVPHIGQRVFNFWPSKESGANLLCTSFWKILPKSSQRLFPKARLTLGVAEKGTPEALNIGQAVFDFLTPSESRTLASLLLTMGVSLVRDIPEPVAKNLKALPNVTSVTGPMLRALLKSKQAGTCLLQEMQSNPHILPVLFDLVIPINVEIRDLDGCHLLPLANGTLGKLKLWHTDEGHSKSYFVVSEDELKLFEFASDCLVKAATIGVMLGPVLENGEFNLTKLNLSDVGKLLESKPAITNPNDEEDKWLAKFWKYWNSKVASSSPTPNADTLNAHVYRATRNGTPFYARPSSFDGQAAVVEPSSSEHKQLCDSFPGLSRFDAQFMPRSLAKNEGSFESEESFKRFIRSVRLLSDHDGFGAFVKTQLGEDELQNLRYLVIYHLSNGMLDCHLADFPSLGSDLQLIPLWPVCDVSPSNELISAKDALMVSHPDLLVPWMKDCRRFLLYEFSSRNENCLMKLGVEKLPIEVLLRDYVLPMPPALDAIQMKQYPQLISAISHGTLPTDWILINNIAADGNCNLKKVSDLYDHEDQIFMAAFRYQQATRFLHKDVQIYRYFWLKLGLHHRASNLIKADDYIQCLQVLKSRFSASNTQDNMQLEQDSETVLTPLIVPNSSIQNFEAADWKGIAGESVFRSRTDFSAEPEYRRNTMAILANDKKLLCLSEIILPEYAPVCWTETPFALHQPTKEVLVHIPPSHGKPSVTMVLQHLQRMTILSEDLKQGQVRDFLGDLDETYTYLQDHLDDSKAGFNLGNIAIWLNLDTSNHNNVQLEDIASSWQGIEHLVLSSSVDAGPIKAVRAGLMRFEKLLRVLGCSSISYPTVTRPTLHLASSVSKSLRQLRKEGKLLDIEYETEGKRIKAHKLVLAAMSEKCAHQFNICWPQVPLISYDKNTDPEDYISYHTLSTMIDYAYEEEIDWKEMEVSDDDDEEARATKLSLLLDLHKGADCWLVPALKSEVEDKILVAGKAFVNLSNVVEVKECAEQVRAMAFAEWCAAMIAENQHIVDKAHNEN